MEAAARCQESRVLLGVGGALFETSRTTLTAVPGTMLEAIFSGWHAQRGPTVEDNRGINTAETQNKPGDNTARVENKRRITPG